MYELLSQLAPGTPLRLGIERILQQRKGALMILGHDQRVDMVCRGGFRLENCEFTPARLAELAKMDGGLVLADSLSEIVAANVHFTPDIDLPTDETGARHRTAQQLARQLGKPVVAVSELRFVATVFHDGQKVELEPPTEIAARVNQEMFSLDRLRRRLDDRVQYLSHLEVTGLSTYRVVTEVISQAELIRRVGMSVEMKTITMGGEGRLVSLQLSDLMRGVTDLREMTIHDYIRLRRRVNAVAKQLEELSDHDLSVLQRVGRVLGFRELDEAVQPRGFRVLSQAGRLPASVRDEVVRYFRGDFQKMLQAPASQFERVEGVGSTRAAWLHRYLTRHRIDIS